MKTCGLIMILLALLFLAIPVVAMELTPEDRAVLAHVVLDPDTWADHASKTVGNWVVTAKIKKYRADYLAKKDLPGYKTRAQREAKTFREEGLP